MKKRMTMFTKIGLLVMSALFLFSACTEDKYYTDPDMLTQWKTQDFNVNEGQWQWENSDASYFREFDYSLLTNYVVEKGAITASALIDGTFRMLPFTTYSYDETNQMYLAETVNFEYWAGGIRFNVTALDLFDNTPITYQPMSYTFKVTVLYP